MAKEKEFKFKAPKNAAKAADRLWQVREERLKAQRGVEPLKAEESALKDWLINTLPASDASGVAGALCQVSVVKKDVPTIEDWDKFFAFVKKGNHFELLAHAFNAEALDAMLEKKKKIPGVKMFTTKTVSIKKL